MESVEELLLKRAHAADVEIADLHDPEPVASACRAEGMVARHEPTGCDADAVNGGPEWHDGRCQSSCSEEAAAVHALRRVCGQRPPRIPGR